MRSRERYIKQYPEDSSLCQLQTEETEKCVVNEDCCKYFLYLCVFHISIKIQKIISVDGVALSN